MSRSALSSSISRPALIGMPAERNSRPKMRTLRTRDPPETGGRSESHGDATASARPRALDQPLERLALERLEVLLVLQQAPERVDDHPLVEIALPERDQRPCPVERFRD